MVHDDSASDASTYSGCASDFIYWNTNLVDFELPVSGFPPDVYYTPIITQSVPGCPIQCKARSAIFPTQTPSYVLQFQTDNGKTTFSASEFGLIGLTDLFEISCTSILSILQPDMRTIKDSAQITFTDGSGFTSIPTFPDPTGDIVIIGGGGSIDIGGGGSDETDPDTGFNPDSNSIDCTSDRILFLSDFTQVDYYITYNSNYRLLEPAILQYIPGCPMTCSLDENMSGGIVSTNIFNFDSNTGRISIKTTNPSDERDIQMKLTCTSTESTDFAF